MILKKKPRVERILQRGIKLVSLGITGKLRKVVEEGERLTSYNVGIPRVDIYEYEGRGYYIINEPSLSSREVEIYYKIMDELYFSLKPIVEVDPSKVLDEVFKTMSKVYRDIDINKIKYYVIRDTLGYGPLDTLMRDPRIEDISCEGINRPIRVFHRDFSYLDWLITNIIFEDEEEANRMALLLAHKARRHLSTAFPIAEGTLPEKHRIVVTYGFEVTPFGPGFAVRKFREEPLSIAHLIKFGTVSPLMAAYWWIILENKGSAFIVGEMASGKSVHPESTLMALIDGVPRILTIEELWRLLESKVKTVSRTREIEYINLRDTNVKILALNGLNIEWQKPQYIIRHKAPRKLVKIKLYSGRELIVTQDHSLLVLRPNGIIDVIRPQDLNKGMYLIGMKKLKLPTISKHLLLQEIIKLLGQQGLLFKVKGLERKIYYHEVLRILNHNDQITDIYITGLNTKTQVPLEAIFKPEFGYLLGLFISEGYDNGQEVHLYIGSSNQELENKLEEIIKKLGLRYSRHKLKTCLRISFPPIISKIIRAFNCGKKSDEKQIPSIAWAIGREWLIHLIAGIIDGDGYVFEKGIEITTSSKKLAYGLLYAFTVLGIYPTLRIKTNKRTLKKYYTVYIPTYWIDELNEILHTIIPSKQSKLLRGVSSRTTFHSEIDIIPKECLYLLSKKASREIQMYLRGLYYSNEKASRKSLTKYYNMLPKEIKNLINSNLIFEKVKEVEIIESNAKHVYDIEVPGVENFEVNTIFVHNTTLMNALLTLLPPNAKIVTIEDTPELRLPHIGWKPFVARHTYTLTGKETEISLFDLVKLALRERATCIAIGEIRGEEAYVFIQALASGHGGVCLKYDEPMVIRRNGIVEITPIGKLVEEFFNGKIHGKIEVLSYDHKHGLRWRALKRVIMVNGVTTWVKIRTKEGRSIEVTSDHLIPILTKNNSIKYKRAVEIKKGDRILIASKLPVEPKFTTINEILNLLNRDEIINIYDGFPILKLDENLGFILGLYVALGVIEENQVIFNIKSYNEELIKEIIKSFNESFNIEPSIRKERGFIIYVNSKPLALLLRKLIGNKLENRDLPCLLLNTPQEFRMGIIKGYWLGRGCLTSNGSKSIVLVEVPSRDLAYKIHYLMKSLGIESIIKEVSVNKPNNVNNAKRYLIEVREFQSIDILNGIRSINASKNEVPRGKVRDVYLDTVEEVEVYVSNEPAYDIEVEANHMFVHGSSIITHNCTFHGDSLESMVMRLTTPPINVPLSFLPLISNVIITRYIRIPGRRPMRRVTKVYEITGLKGPTELEYKVIFEWNILEDKHYPDDPEEVIKKSIKLKRIATLLGWDDEILLQELVRRRDLLKKLVEEGKLSYNEVALAIQNYYKEVWKPLH